MSVFEEYKVDIWEKILDLEKVKATFEETELMRMQVL